MWHLWKQKVKTQSWCWLAIKRHSTTFSKILHAVQTFSQQRSYDRMSCGRESSLNYIHFHSAHFCTMKPCSLWNLRTAVQFSEVVQTKSRLYATLTGSGEMEQRKWDLGLNLADRPSPCAWSHDAVPVGMSSIWELSPSGGGNFDDDESPAIGTIPVSINSMKISSVKIQEMN